MTLTPESRVLLTEALRPPPGYRVETAVGTTYSLNLTALLLAPLSFAVFDQANSTDIDALDPIRLLEAVSRHAEHTTVFCQAGGIHVPSNYGRILTFTEDSILEVMPVHEGSIFHPKIWALRFIDQFDRRLHRVVILSRNMTLDRSWDTALVLDEDENGVIDARPAADFVRRLPEMAIRRPVAEDRVRQVNDLADSLSAARLVAPAPFSAGRLLPTGLTRDLVWPFPERAERLLAISPFLTESALKSLAALTEHRTLVSRSESLELVGSEPLRGWSVNVLQRLAETDPSVEITELSPAATEFPGASEGLHAKTFVFDLAGGRSVTVTGSANLTSRKWGRNVEFEAVLSGPSQHCGVAAVLDGPSEAPGLGSLLEVYSVSGEAVVGDAEIETLNAIERFHQQLAVSAPNLHVTAVDDDTVEARLRLTVPRDPPGRTTIWLASLPKGAHGQELGESLTWRIAPSNVTPFIAIETTVGDGAAAAIRRCVIKAALTGAVDGRRHDAVFSVLRSKQDVLRYLVFLLGDPSYDALFAQLAGIDRERSGNDTKSGSAGPAIALFEPLVRATGRDGDALVRIASLMDELRELPNGDELVPDGFDQLWTVVWQVHQERLS
jgi:hypothetical protein